MRRVVLIAFTLVAAACKLDVAEPKTSITPGTPASWGLIGQTTVSTAKYLLGQTNDAHGGSAALVIVGTDSLNVQFSGITQPVRADKYRGKRVRFSAWVKHENASGKAIGLWMRVDGPGVIQAFDNMGTHSLKGTAAWHQVEIILDVPSNAVGIVFGALMHGGGTLLVDDMKWEIIPPNGPTTDQQTGPSPTPFDASGFYSTVSRLEPENLNFELKSP
jgi:hypothetical protein